jgi:hypothetical protein
VHQRADDFFAKATSKRDPLGLGFGAGDDPTAIKATVQAEIGDVDKLARGETVDHRVGCAVRVIK